MRTIGLFSSGRHDWGYLMPLAEVLSRREELRVVLFRACDAFTAEELSGMPAGIEPVSFCILPPGREVSPSLVAEVSAGFADALDAHPVDILAVVGDRTETLAVCVVAAAGGVVLAHLHGGDRAPGELDDANRHAITKLSHVHFPATDESARRILRLGEQAWRVHTVGSTGLDGILAHGLADDRKVSAALGRTLEKPYAVLLYHPSGQGEDGEVAAAEEICNALENIGLMCVCVAGNRDGGTGCIHKILVKFSSKHNWPIVPTLERSVFLRLIGDAVALVGNSSSGMIESAAVDAVVLNVGDRQRGRQRSGNVIDVPAERTAIETALRRLLDDEAYDRTLRSAECVFGDAKASERIAEVLATMALDGRTRIKLIEY